MTGRAAATLAASPLARRGAMALPIERPDELIAEAHAAGRHASEVVQRTPPTDPWDRGNPDRWLESATGGEALHRLMHSRTLRDQLRALTGLEVRPLGEQGAFSYYRRPGHHLGLHCDIQHCDVAVIVVCASQGPGGNLVAYPGRAREPLTSIRLTPHLGARRVTASPGLAIIVLGGHIPHRITPIRAGGLRIVAPLCYRLLGRTARPAPASLGEHTTSGSP